MRRPKKFLLLIILMLSINFATGFMPSMAAIQTERITVSEDTKIEADNPDLNYGADPQVRVWKASRVDGLLYFNISSSIVFQFLAKYFTSLGTPLSCKAHL